MTQTISKDALVEKLIELDNARFTGQVLIKFQQQDYWTLHFTGGWIFYALSNSTYKWKRKLLLHCPKPAKDEVLKKFLDHSNEQSSNAWQYHFLSSLFEAKEIDKLEADRIAFLVVHEALSEILIVADKGLEFNEINESLVDPPGKSFKPLKTVNEVREVEQIWQGAKLPGNSFNLALIIKELKLRQQQSSTFLYLKYLDGRHTLWDLAALTNQPASKVAQVLIPEIISGVIELIKVDDLPLSLSQNKVPVSKEVKLEKTELNKLRLNKNSDLKPLKQTKKKVLLPLAMVFLSLSLLSIGYYLFYQIGLSKQASLASSVPAVSMGKSNKVPAPSIPSLPSDIQFYNLMQDVPNVPSGAFSYGGAFAWASLRSQKLISAIFQARPLYQLRYREPLSGNPGDGMGVDMLLNNQLSFSQNSRPLTDSEYNTAKVRGFKLQEVPIGIDAVVFFCHPDLNIQGLSVEQLQGIYLGKFTNWNQVGGPNLPIITISNDPKDGTLQMLMQGVPGGLSSVRVTKIVRDYTASIRLASDTPGSIGFGSVSTVAGQETIKPLAIAKLNSNQYVNPYIGGQVHINSPVIQNGDYPLTRNIFVDIRRDGTFNEQAGVAYTNLLLSWEGQRLVEQAGLIPFR